MKSATVISIKIFVAMLLFAAGAIPTPVRAADAAPKIEVVFVLDTTSSMSLLIEGAKRKIWTIAKQVVGGRPTPAIKLGLVGFRDRNDSYVTKAFDLTDDIDAIYGHLTAFAAYGGGDEPESVNQALHEAVTKLSWNKNPGTLKIVFLVGDAPSHMDYPDDVKYPETIRLAAQAGIIINTIQCGNKPQTTRFWQEIAGMAEGAYVQIDQSGNMNAIATPVDAELSRLGSELSRTVVPYGDPAKQAEVRSKAAAADRADADRLLYLNIDRAEFGAKVVVTGQGELIWDVVNRKVKLEEIPDSELPLLMKGMTLQERTTFVEEQFNKRKDLQIKVDALATQRDEYIKTEMSKLAGGGGDSFDSKVAEIVQAQALRRGIKYDMSAAPAPAK